MDDRQDVVRSKLERLLPRRHRQRLDRLRLRDAGHGWDVFGASRAGVALGLHIVRPLYERWFRVRSHGAEHIPAEGPTLVVANHSGTLPLDAMMLWADVLLQTDPPRLPRAVGDYFVPIMPFVSILFTRAGMISGSRDNVRAALEAGELLALFPEGVAGVGKPFRERYHLQRWSVGHAELGIRYGAAVVPTAIIGAEEALPQLTRLESVRLFGAPYLPIPATPIPLPIRYHVWYGEPLRFERDYRPEQADDAGAVREAAHRVETRVQALIDEGLAARKGLFR